MENSILITLVSLGCSWTYGVGSGYDPDIHNTDYPHEYSLQEYEIIKGENWPDYDNFLKNRKNEEYFDSDVWKELKEFHLPTALSEIAWDEDINNRHSFRGLIANNLQITNSNYSAGGSSNEQQFDAMSKIFGNPKKRKKFLDKKPVVMWGITSTARIFRNNQSKMLPKQIDTNFNEDNEEELYSALYVKLYYDHEQEVANLSNQIELWNIIFDHYDVPVIWFDTFNTHKYSDPPRNFLQGGDLLTQMLKIGKIKYKNFFNVYHFSSWEDDDPRITAAVKAKLLNPYSFHPTKQGHKVISEILLPHIKELNKTYYN